MLNFPRFFLIKGHPENLAFQPLENLFRIAAGVNERVAREGWMIPAQGWVWVADAARTAIATAVRQGFSVFMRVCGPQRGKPAHGV